MSVLDSIWVLFTILLNIEFEIEQPDEAGFSEENREEVKTILSEVKVRFKFIDKEVVLEDWSELIKLNDDKTFKNKEELKDVFKSCLENIDEKNIVFSCGSGVTACVLALAYSLINDKYHPCIYDGSWAEYGII